MRRAKKGNPLDTGKQILSLSIAGRVTVRVSQKLFDYEAAQTVHNEDDVPFLESWLYKEAGKYVVRSIGERQAVPAPIGLGRRVAYQPKPNSGDIFGKPSRPKHWRVGVLDGPCLCQMSR
ncbi:hypothetical protein GCM10011290_14330 [Vogesella alkaliphila]|uniref:Uncharacterized protein n=1 Tax=Vogesella alkaliphila TaxID=1193621 RepID=A0ABQ2YL26_9NEIS|nr:hypothetical protein GCM10011290_14330 [Vogesella alkaliphila]